MSFKLYIKNITPSVKVGNESVEGCIEPNSFKEIENILKRNYGWKMNYNFVLRNLNIIWKGRNEIEVDKDINTLICKWVCLTIENLKKCLFL